MVIVQLAPRMHWIYGVYLFLSTVQGPALLCMLTMQKTTRCSIVRFDISNSTTTTTVENMSKESACAAALSVFFAVLFMIRTSDSEGVDDDDTTSLSKTLMRASFWCFVFCHGCVLHCGWPRSLTRNDIFATSSLRTLALWVVCRLDDKRAALIGGSTLYMMWLLAYFEFYVEGSFVMLAITMLLDAVLALGHGYDIITTDLVVSNCRLCYIAISGWTTILWLPLLTG
jgi:hypothetical protein